VGSLDEEAEEFLASLVQAMLSRGKKPGMGDRFESSEFDDSL
jgi:hypothetical protein